MKKRLIWLTAAVTGAGLYALAEAVITSPAGTVDESDVALETAVDAVQSVPADAVQAAGDLVRYAGDELNNTVHGIRAAFAGATPKETVQDRMLSDITASWNASDAIEMRTYTISPVVGGELAASNEEAAVDVRGFFAGIDFPEGTSAYYRPDVRRLVVFNTPANLNKIEEILSRYHHAERSYKQVEIQAKFIEVNQSVLNQLGFTWRIEDAAGATGVRLFDDWQLNDNQDVLSAGLRTAAQAFGGTPGSGSMVLTKTGWMPLRVAINALEQSGNSDVLSAPSLTTMDGKAAEIWIGEDREVPQSFDVKSEDLNIHIEHSNWNSELMGVHFSVTPEIQKNNLIRLKLNPKIVDLIGYDTYKVSPEASMLAINGAPLNSSDMDGRYPILDVPTEGLSQAYDLMQATLGFSPNPAATDTVTTPRYYDSSRRMTHEEFGVPLAAIHGSLPYFRVREIKTQVNVADGNTVGLGGLIYDRLETYKDKIPVLGSIPLVGRLFRSEGERSIKRNLMIFVSATQVANNGQRRSDLAINN